MPLRLIAALLAVILALGTYAWVLSARNTALETLAEALTAELRVAAIRVAQADNARQRAADEAQRHAAASAEMEQIREWIIREDDNAPIPPLLRDALDRILRPAPR